MERLLGGVAITLGVISALIYLYRSRERKGESEGFLIFGFAILISGATVLLIFYYFLQFYIPGSFINYTFYIDSSDVDLNYIRIERIGWVGFFIIYSLHVFAQERTVIKGTRYVFSIILIGLIILMGFTLHFDFFNTLQTLCYGYLGLVVTIFLIIMTRNSLIEFKSVTAFLLTALVFTSLSLRFLGLSFKELNIIPLFTPHFIIITGYILTIIPILINSSRLAKANYYWIGNLKIIMTFLTFAIFLYILVGDITKLLTLAVFVIISIFAAVDTLSSIRSVSLEKSLPDSKADQPGVLGLFIRPQII